MDIIREDYVALIGVSQDIETAKLIT